MDERESRVVFLDVDGVLVPWGSTEHVLDPSCVDRVRRIAGHARIVLTSSWPIEEVVRRGVPVDDALDGRTERRASELARLLGVHRYLSEHPEVREWVSVDDDLQVDVLRRALRRAPCPWAAALLAHERRFLRTDWKCLYPFDAPAPEGSGLTEDLYLRALAALGVEPPRGAATDR